MMKDAATKKSKKDIIIGLLLLISVIASVVILSCLSSDKNRNAQKLGLAIPKAPIQATDIAFKDMKGEVVRLSDYRGKVIFLNLWASWCIPCKMEMPSMERLYKRFDGEDFEMIALNIETDMQNDKLAKYIDENNYTFTIGMDESMESMNNYYTGSTPITYLIGRDFNIKGRLIGTTDWYSKPAIGFIKSLLAENGTEQ